MAHWCNPLTLKPEQSGRVGSRHDRTSPPERHDKGSRTRLALKTAASSSHILLHSNWDGGGGNFIIGSYRDVSSKNFCYEAILEVWQDFDRVHWGKEG